MSIFPIKSLQSLYKTVKGFKIILAGTTLNFANVKHFQKFENVSH